MGGGGVIEVPLFKGIDIFFRWGSNIILVGHFEKGSSDFSRIIINDYTILKNVTFGKKRKTKQTAGVALPTRPLASGESKPTRASESYMLTLYVEFIYNNYHL